VGGEFGPAAAAVDAGVGAHGAKDAVAGDGDVFGVFDDGVERGVETFAALEENAGGAGVPVDGAGVGDFVFVSDLPGGAPVNEFFFDGFAFGMVADDAAAGVPFEDLHLKPFSTADSPGDLASHVRCPFLVGFASAGRGCG
jgi:hypothetical protein